MQDTDETRHDEQTEQTPYASPTNRPSRAYMIGLTTAILLFLATLTTVVITILIARARQTEREDEFDLTMTAVYATMRELERAVVEVPTAPEITPGVYAFEVQGSPAYSAAEVCDGQTLTGRILDADGSPTDAVTVRVWGDFTPDRVVDTGPVVGLEPGEWRLTLAGMVNRRVWVQLTVGEQYVSAPVAAVFSEEGCDANTASITFRQVTPTEE
ncbi:MAG: hypothetical protein GYB65_11060 [Chloroflexi bacterium]|nr:hypothetical protein [Chloroflexota bacterium]